MASSPVSSPTTSPTLNKLAHAEIPSNVEIKNDAAATTKSHSGLRALVAGGVGGVCAVIVGHPFDLVKVRLQTAEKAIYKSSIDVVKKTIAREGLARGLYAGVSAPLVGVTPMCKFDVLNRQLSDDASADVVTR
jgi:solute carrier family 25 carnitine/acylcarnitine transporter 20/29